MIYNVITDKQQTINGQKTQSISYPESGYLLNTTSQWCFLFKFNRGIRDFIG